MPCFLHYGQVHKYKHCVQAFCLSLSILGGFHFNPLTFELVTSDINGVLVLPLQKYINHSD